MGRARRRMALAAALMVSLPVGLARASVEGTFGAASEIVVQLDPPGRPELPAGFPRGGPIKISGPLPLGGDVTTSYRVNAEGTRIVYIADQETNSINELFSVPIGGGPVTKISGPQVGGGNVLFFLITPDNQVVYGADQDIDERAELYHVPITGGTVTKISGSLPVGGDVTAFLTSPDGSRVAYIADQDVNDVLEMYSVPTTGGATTKLNDPLVAGGAVITYNITPNSTRVVYRADQVTNDVEELFSVPIDGGVVTKLNPTPVLNGDVGSFIPSSVGRVFYFADLDTDTVNEQYSVPEAGGTVIKVNAPLVTGGDVVTVNIGSTWVNYRADQDVDELFELYTTPTAGGAAFKVSGPLTPGGDILFATSAPADVRLVYQADQDVDNLIELYTLPVTGGGSTKLNGPLVPLGDVTAFAAPGVQGNLPPRVTYLADQDADEVFEVFSVPLLGGPAVQLNAPLAVGGDVTSNVIANSRGLVAYRADQDADEVFEVYYAPSDGAGPVTQLNVNPVAGGDVTDFLISPPPRVVVYRADQDADEVFELYARLLDGDADGDGVSDAVDCLVIDDGVWETPGEASLLLLSHTGGFGGTTTLSWSAPAIPGGTSIAYDVLRSSEPDDFETATTCIESDDASDTLATDTATPATGEVFHYLVRGGNLCGEGPLGLQTGRGCP